MLCILRINVLEADLQQTDQIKMENIELKCRLEETQRKLYLCQQEIAVTSSQLSQLEDLASRIESREKLNSSDKHSEVTELRLVYFNYNVRIMVLRFAISNVSHQINLKNHTGNVENKVL